MQVTETLNEGLKRKLTVTIPAADLASKLDTKLKDMSTQANIKGFRPGKVPVGHLRKVYGRSAMSEVMQEEINTSVQQTLSERDERAAGQPEIDLTEDQAKLDDVLGGGADLAFDVSYEVLPAIELMDFKKIEVETPVIEIEDAELDKEVERVFRNNRAYEDKGDDAVIAKGDKVGLSYIGKIKDEPFEGGTAEHIHIIVGSGDFIPGFEDGMIGMKKGGGQELKVTFPKEYGDADLAGKKATFEVEILHIEAPTDARLDDEFAKSLGLDDLAALRDAIKQQMNQSNQTLISQRVKRQVLDALDEGHKIDVPEQLVEGEFVSIWDRVKHEVEHHGRSFEDEGTTEEKARELYRKIAERRVRLGLVVAEIGSKNQVQVTEEEHQQALIAEVQRFPGQEQQVYDYYRNNPQALANLRAPVFENKVVDFVTELAKSSEKKMTREELAKLNQDEADEVPEQHHH
jgi:trigger factor